MRPEGTPAPAGTDTGTNECPNCASLEYPYFCEDGVIWGPCDWESEALAFTEYQVCGCTCHAD
jgi:hypothetical protein